VKPLAGGADAAALIPQKPPMVLVDALVACEGNRAVARFTIPERHLMVSGGRLTEAGLIEHMAQTAALKAGYEMKIRDATPRLGYLAGIRNLKILQLPAIGETVETEIVVAGEVFGITRIQARTHCHGRLCAYSELRIAMPTH
jgi:predicted hotdog family 3-hydroxylacyl-ACP dehydratase